MSKEWHFARDTPCSTDVNTSRAAPSFNGFRSLFNHLKLTLFISCSHLFVAEISIESPQKLFTLLLSIETKGQTIRAQPVVLTQYLFIFLLMSINKNICLVKEASQLKQRWPWSREVGENKPSLHSGENTGRGRSHNCSHLVNPSTLIKGIFPYSCIPARLRHHSPHNSIS